jgi:addiction module HigA family antidote
VNRSDSKRLCSLKHPGQVLATFIEPYGISQNSLARTMGVPPRRINEILLGKRSITADTAIGLADVFRTGPLFWMRLQALYDIAVAQLLRRDRPVPPREPLRSELLDDCAFEGTDFDKHLAELHRLLRAKIDHRAQGDALDDAWRDELQKPHDAVGSHEAGGPHEAGGSHDADGPHEAGGSHEADVRMRRTGRVTEDR